MLSPSTAEVQLSKPKAGDPQTFTVRACQPGARPSACPFATCPGNRTVCGPLRGLVAGGRYTISATATYPGPRTVPAANTITLLVPANTAPTLLDAKPAGIIARVRATAAPPVGGSPVLSVSGAAMGRSEAGRSFERLRFRRCRGTCSAWPPRLRRWPSPTPSLPCRLAPVQYVWTFTNLGGGTVTVNTTGPSLLTPSGLLAPATAYDVTVAARRAAGLSPPSNTLRVLTIDGDFLVCPPDRPLMCGSTCIAATRCCKSNSVIGVRCVAPQVCPADGDVCGEQGAGSATCRRQHFAAAGWQRTQAGPNRFAH